MASARFLYVFLDEAGNLSFAPNGTRHFLLTSIAKERPFDIYKPLADLKYDLMEAGLEIEYFHASEDAQQVRDRVFQINSSLPLAAHSGKFAGRSAEKPRGDILETLGN